MNTQHQKAMTIQTHETCPTCGGDCLNVGNMPPSRFPAIRALGVTQEIWQCQKCGEEFVKNVRQPTEQSLLAS
jgi:ribosomal protein L37AE/L43A